MSVSRARPPTLEYKAKTTEFHFYCALPEPLPFYLCQFFSIQDLVAFLLVSKEANRLAQEALPHAIKKEHEKGPEKSREFNIKLTKRALALLEGETKTPKDALVLRKNIETLLSYGVRAEGKEIIEKVLRFGHSGILGLLHQRRVPYNATFAMIDALNYDHPAILEFLAECGLDLNPGVSMALNNNKLKCLPILVAMGCDFNQADIVGETQIQKLLQIHPRINPREFDRKKTIFATLINSGVYIKDSAMLKSWFEQMAEENRPSRPAAIGIEHMFFLSDDLIREVTSSFNESSHRWTAFSAYKDDVIKILDGYIPKQAQFAKSFRMFKIKKALMPTQQSREKAVELPSLRSRVTEE